MLEQEQGSKLIVGACYAQGVQENRVTDEGGDWLELGSMEMTRAREAGERLGTVMGNDR